MKLFIAPALAAALLLAGCAAGPASPPQNTSPSFGDLDAIAAPGEVQGQGTVIQVGDADAQLCLGAVAESYPPRCGGPDIDGWDWGTVAGTFETSGDVTWGAYVVTGTWDGSRFGLTGAMTLALYDPMPVVDPQLDPDNAGDTDPAELERIQSEIDDSAPFTVLTSSVENGYLFVRVIYDDGSIQAWADETYLPDAVAIRPALRDIG
jgi:hypothetical protein